MGICHWSSRTLLLEIFSYFYIMGIECQFMIIQVSFEYFSERRHLRSFLNEGTTFTTFQMSWGQVKRPQNGSIWFGMCHTKGTIPCAIKCQSTISTCRYTKSLLAIIDKYDVAIIQWTWWYKALLEASMIKIALWINNCADDWTAERAIIARNGRIYNNTVDFIVDSAFNIFRWTFLITLIIPTLITDCNELTWKINKKNNRHFS